MSELRRKRQEEREQPRPKGRALRKIVIAAGVILVAFGIYYFIYYRTSHKLDAFAKCLSQKNLKMYGAYWCPHCAEQHEMFNESFEYVPYIECGVPRDQHAETQVCLQAGVKQFPTWVFPDGSREARVFPLEELSRRSGCALP